MVLCNLSFLKSKNLYSKRKSSLASPVFSELTSKGNTFLHFPKTFISSAFISISPVGILVFLLLLSTTFPLTLITHSVTKSFAKFISSSLSLITICVIPNWSRKSINFIEPKFLIVCIHPAIVTTSPTFVMFNSPQL